MVKQRVILFSALMAVVVAILVLLVVFGEIFQCQRTVVGVPPVPPAPGEYVVPIRGSSLALQTESETVELPPGMVLEIIESSDQTLRARLVADGAEGVITDWYRGSRSLLGRADAELVGLMSSPDYSALEALMVSASLGEGWRGDAYPYALASGLSPEGGRHREWEVAFYSPGLGRCLLVLLTAGARPFVSEVSPPADTGDDYTTWPLGSARNALSGIAVDSPKALENALLADDRPLPERERWSLSRIYLVHQNDPQDTEEPHRNRPTYRVLLRFPTPMNEAEERRYTDLIIDAADGDFIARLEG